MLTGRRKRPLVRDGSTLRDARLIVIAAEGSDTEEQYFTLFRDSRVQVKVISSQDGLSAPKHVLANLRRFRREFQLGQGDELWLAVDTDRRPESALSEVAAAAQAGGFRMAVSNPCFELWLALHVADALPEDVNTCARIVDFLKARLGGYGKANVRAERFADGIAIAVERARAMDGNPEHRWPNARGTHVYRIVESIRGLIIPAG